MAGPGDDDLTGENANAGAPFPLAPGESLDDGWDDYPVSEQPELDMLDDPLSGIFTPQSMPDDPAMVSDRGIDRSALLPDAAQGNGFEAGMPGLEEVRQVPGLLDACRRLRIEYQARKTMQSGLRSTPQKTVIDRGTRDAYQVSAQPERDAEIRSTYAKAVADAGITHQTLQDDRELLRSWLKEEAKKLGKQLTQDRRDLVTKVKAHYAKPEVLKELGQMLAITMSYRVGLPFMRSAETPDAGIISGEYFPAEASPNTKTDLGTDVWTPRFEPKSNDWRDVGKDYQQYEVVNGDEPGLRLNWNEWSDSPDHNQSPFTARFSVIDELYGFRSAEEWRNKIYSDHPVTILAHRKFGQPNAIMNLCNAIRDTDDADRFVPLKEFVNWTVGKIGYATDELEDDLSITYALDYIDWGDFVPLLLLASSKIVAGDSDPLLEVLKREIIPSMDVASYSDIAGYLLAAVGIAFMVATWGAGATLAVPLYALDVLVTASGLLLSGKDFFDAVMAAQQGYAEDLIAAIDPQLKAFETTSNVAVAGGTLLAEILLTVLFPPSRAVMRGAAHAVEEPAETLLHQGLRSDLPDINMRGLPDETPTPAPLRSDITDPDMPDAPVTRSSTTEPEPDAIVSRPAEPATDSPGAGAKAKETDISNPERSLDDGGSSRHPQDEFEWEEPVVEWTESAPLTIVYPDGSKKVLWEELADFRITDPLHPDYKKQSEIWQWVQHNRGRKYDAEKGAYKHQRGLGWDPGEASVAYREHLEALGRPYDARSLRTARGYASHPEKRIIEHWAQLNPPLARDINNGSPPPNWLFKAEDGKWYPKDAIDFGHKLDVVIFDQTMFRLERELAEMVADGTASTVKSAEKANEVLLKFKRHFMHTVDNYRPETKIFNQDAGRNIGVGYLDNMEPTSALDLMARQKSLERGIPGAETNGLDIMETLMEDYLKAIPESQVANEVLMHLLL